VTDPDSNHRQRIVLAQSLAVLAFFFVVHGAHAQALPGSVVPSQQASDVVDRPR
jgi:hypothetical protein